MKELPRESAAISSVRLWIKPKIEWEIPATSEKTKTKGKS
jgi:hypothetical protein